MLIFGAEIWNRISKLYPKYVYGILIVSLVVMWESPLEGIIWVNCMNFTIMIMCI